MTHEFHALSPSEKKVAAKVLNHQGYSTRRLESLLGIDDTTAWRALKEATPEALKQFEVDFTEAIAEMKRKGIGLVQKRLLELIPKERRIDQVVKAGEFFEGKSGTGVAVQVNNNLRSIEFVMDEGETSHA